MSEAKKPRRVNLEGKVFGRWKVLGKQEGAMWLCHCQCGTVKSVHRTNLIQGKSLSCGCFRKEVLTEIRTSHGQRNTKLYAKWCKMKDRCYNPKLKDYKNYGGRGIKVCEEWHKFENFYEWSMKNGYRDGLEIDRIDVNGDYTPNNCRFVPRLINANNKRNNRFITHNGETLTLSQWANKLGINRKTITSRITYGWSESELLKKVGEKG